MTNLLIRDVPDDIVAGIDSNASRLGLSRSEYLRRVATHAAHQPGALAASDLAWFSSTFSDLADDELMDQAWQ